MHQRRVSDGMATPTSNVNRKNLSSKFMGRSKGESPSNLNSTVKVGRKAITIQPVHDEECISSIIQQKVSSLKHKFEELDSMRKRLIESRCDLREDNDSRNSTLQRSRGKSSELNSTGSYYKDFNKTRPEGFLSKVIMEETFDSELHKEKKSTQKALLEKNIIERESQEKTKQFQSTINALTSDIEVLNKKLISHQKELKEHDVLKKKQEILIRSQASEIKSLETQLSSSSSTIESLTKQLKKLENKLNDFTSNKSNTNTAIKNLSNIILSKDSPTKSDPSQFINKYLETLQDLHDSDTFALMILTKLESKNYRKAQEKLTKAKPEMLKRIEKTCNSIEELERAVYECRSPSPVNRKSTQGFYERASEVMEGRESTEWVAWIKCQAAAVEELILISGIGG